MDHFKEEIIIKKNRLMNEVLFVLSLISMVLAGAYVLFMIQMLFFAFDWFTLITVLLAAGCAVLIYLRRDRLRTEYEYTFTNGEMDFAMVFNNQKRKNLGTMRVRNVEAFGPVSGKAFQRYVTMKNIKTSNWFLNRGAELYYFYFSKEDAKRLIVIEPSEEMVDLIKKYLPYGAYQG
ncbi:MAG: hypothetical protein IJ461_06110 [Clostridia bacterium]|nr:hypothetical protein [Clostridia bacterium]